MRTHVLLVAASALPATVNFILTPVITSEVSTLEYGQYVNYLTLFAVLNVLVGLASAGFVSNAYIQPEARGRIAASLGCLMLATVVPSALLAAVGVRQAGLRDAAMAIPLVLSAALNYAVTAFQAFMILRRQYGVLLILALAQVVTQVAVVLLLLANRRLDLWGLVVAHLAGAALSALATGVLWWRLGLGIERPDWPTVRRAIVYGLPLVPHLFLSLASGSFDRWYLLSVGAVEALAVYGVALTVAGAVPILLDVANRVYSPTVFERLKAAELRLAGFARGMVSFVVLAMLLAALVALAGYWFVLLAFDPKYAGAAWLCVYLALASCAFALYYAAAPFLYYFNQTHLVLAASAAGAMATVLCSLALVGPMSLHGLIAGKLAGFLVSGVVALACAASVLKRQRAGVSEVA